jgi:hydroxypyruvate reductase
MMALPARGVTLQDKQEATTHLLRAGADVHQLNVVRKHLSAIKGGWLAASTRARCHTLAISDVIGDDVSTIGSGPTVGDTSTFAEALEIVDRFGGLPAFGRRLVDRLTRGAAGELEETPKPGDPRLAGNETVVAGGRHDAMQGAAEEAARRGYEVLVLDDPVVGEARESAGRYIGRVRSLCEGVTRPLCVISSGETTVHVRGSGLGGRNQEFALAAASGLLSLGFGVTLASIGTDGIDGSTTAAGAIADNRTVERARKRGLPEIGDVLGRNDSYHFFDALGDLIRTGPTGTNVGDLQVLLVH